MSQHDPAQLGRYGALSTLLSSILISVHDQSGGKPPHASAAVRWVDLGRLQSQLGFQWAGVEKN